MENNKNLCPLNSTSYDDLHHQLNLCFERIIGSEKRGNNDRSPIINQLEAKPGISPETGREGLDVSAEKTMIQIHKRDGLFRANGGRDGM